MVICYLVLLLLFFHISCAFGFIMMLLLILDYNQKMNNQYF